jgi:C1A family cysteine protease
VTSVKDQGNCGSCVAFGCIGTVEVAVRIKNSQPDLAIDLSEAHLFYCQSTPGVTCDSGWHPDAALNGSLIVA